MAVALCPSAEQLAAFVMGRLNHDDLDEIAAHLETCPPCRTALEAGSAVSDPLMRDLQQAQNHDAFTDETGCQAAVARVEALATSEATHSRADTDDIVPAAPMAFQTVGKYQLLELIGQGGMGAVYKARHTLLKRIVAVKLLPPERLKKTDAVTRFRREIEAAGRLDHPHIIRTHDADEVDGQHLLVMEWLDGDDLHKLVKTGGPLPVSVACDYIRQAALGLAWAHGHNMVHRDVKPSNLLVTKTDDGQPVVKVLDLGLALLHDAARTESEGLTSTGEVMGTFDFIAPEQAMETHAVDARADIYSLGCTFYFLLTGRPPFDGESKTKKLVAHQLEQPMPIGQYRKDVPRRVIDIVTKMMEKDPARRFGSMREVASALEPASDTQLVLPDKAPPTVTPGTEPLAQVSQRRRPPLVAAALWILGILSVAAGVYGIIRITTPEGDFVIETDDPKIKFSVSKGTVTLHDEQTRRTYNVKAICKANGDYELDVRDMGADLSFTTPILTIRRNQTVTLKAMFERKPVAVANPPAGKGVDEAWIKRVAALAPKQQAEAVIAKLRELNPGLGAGGVHASIDGKVVTGLVFGHLDVTNLSPVRALTGLQFLTFANPDRGNPGPLTDLSPLQGLNLKTLDVTNTSVQDLSSLKGMKLTTFRCYKTPVSDLSPLKDLKLRELDCSHTKVRDLSPLKNVPLIKLNCGQTLVSDLTPLQEMPLEELIFDSTNVSDLSPLKKMKLKALFCGNTKVSDLTPLTDMRLTSLDCGGTKVMDLAPLKDMRLRALHVGNTSVSDLSPVKAMGLVDLDCQNTKVLDLSPIKDMLLQGIRCDFNRERDTKILRPIRTLLFINGVSTKIFWKDLDAKNPAVKVKAKEVRRYVGHKLEIKFVAFSPDGKSFFSGSFGEPWVWDVDREVERRRLVGIQGWVHGGAFLNDGVRVAAGGQGGAVVAWDAKTGKKIEQIAPFAVGGPVDDVVCAPDRPLVFYSNMGGVHLYDLDKKQEVRRFPGGRASLSQDGRRLLSCDGKALYLCDVGTGKELGTVTHTGHIISLALAPDGRHAAVSASVGTAVTVWDMNTKKQIKTLDGPARVHAIAFSPDGKRVLTGGADNKVRLWDLDSGKELHRFDGHTGPVLCVRFSPNGQQALSGSADKSIRLWQLPVQ